MRSMKDLDTKLKQSTTLRRILLELRSEPQTFLVLLGNVGVSSRTLTEHLKTCLKEGLVRHEKRNAPYEITQDGLDWLRLGETKPVEDFVIECVKGGPFDGSIVFRVPKRFVQVFNQLYQPATLESLRRIFLVGFEFWVNKYSQAPYVQTIAHGKDFNNDDIWDLTVYETPPGGYPNIKKAIKKTKKEGFFTVVEGKKLGISSLSLMERALDELEEKLSTIM